MPAVFNKTFLDNSGETSTSSWCLPDITEANIATVLGNDGTPEILSAAIAALSLCNDIKDQVVLQPQLFGNELPTDSYAQRELVLVITMEDDVTKKKFTRSVPGVNWDALGLIGTDMVNPAAPLWVAAVAAIESKTVSPDGNAVKVLGGRRAGRRN